MKPSDSHPETYFDPSAGPRDASAEPAAVMPVSPAEPGPQPEASADLPAGLVEGAAALDSLLKEKAREKQKDHKDHKDKGHGKKKKKKKNKEEIRKADPWQRYKALLDTLKSSQDLVDLADHKARFALMIMGALNAAILFAGTRSELLVRVPVPLRPGLYLYFAFYAAIAIYFLLQAVETLRPRRHPPLPRKSEVSDKDESLGLRFFAETLRYDQATYAKAWSSVRVSQLNAELTGQVYTIARINSAKYAAVARLYTGLQAITVLTAAFLIVLGAIVWIDSRMTSTVAQDVASVSESADSQKAKGDKTKKAEADPEAPVKIKAGKPGKGGWAILGEPERFEASGVREPSGIAFSAVRKSFFVVGDEGTLVEFSSAGKVIGQLPASGNLEDVAVHTPSGRLVLLSEKKGELVVFDPLSQKRTGKFKIDNDALLGEAAVDKNQGFEGLAFRPEAGHPGGGVFYLVHQRAPAVMVSFAFDPTAATGTIGAEAMIKRATIPNRDDLTAVTYDAALNRLFVVSDSKDRMAMLSVAGDEQAEIVLPGAQQEGLTFDAEGNLWIADDRAGLLVFRGARARIQAAIKNPPPEPSPNPSPKNPAGTEN